MLKPPWLASQQGLEDQLLGEVVRHERQELEEARDRLVVSIAGDKRQLQVGARDRAEGPRMRAALVAQYMLGAPRNFGSCVSVVGFMLRSPLGD